MYFTYVCTYVNIYFFASNHLKENSISRYGVYWSTVVYGTVPYNLVQYITQNNEMAKKDEAKGRNMMVTLSYYVRYVVLISIIILQLIEGAIVFSTTVL